VQVRFALCSSSTFSRTDKVTDSETFYTSILSLLEDPDEKEEVDALLTWWNRQVSTVCLSMRWLTLSYRKIFPHAFADTRIPIEGSALARIKQRRRELAAQPADRVGEEHAA